ncbi:ABC transporter [Mycobacterium sp. MS1601]|uniref:ArnT family glycosyltransferase n=1 Tax=Mycobacterium sp. MS1601 TaxID=1936029 RepID=UPI0009796709|nr:ABC transporter [Mycobacterium sp. MS1601]AQA01758.1 ABC transporter [Mycobacterium sp. MS1601]
MIARWTNRRLKVAFFVASLVLYLIAGYWLQVRCGFIIGDSLSRVAAAQSVLFSRDPHLAAIGFIFTPLTALVQIPAIALSPVWPEMAERAFSGSIMSALFMAAAVVQILSMGTDRGLPRAYSVTIACMFALNPMIIFYGSNGMSEAPFIFFMTWAVRRLIMWMINDDVHHLVVAGGIAMGLAYLTRYDAVACIAAAGFLVGITTYVRAKSAPRIKRAVLDLLMVSLPGFASFMGWAAVSWLITGEAFAQFTSQYGNAAILAQSGQLKPDFFGGLSFAAVCITLLAPTLLPLAGWTVACRWGKPYWPTVLVPLVVYGAALAFQSFSYATGTTFGFLRFYIIAIPLAASLALLAVPDGVILPTKRPGRYAPPALVDPAASFRGPRSPWGYVAVALVFALSVPAAAWGMGKPKYAPQEFALGAVLAPQPDSLTEQKAYEHRIAATFSTEREIAHYLDGLGLPEGSVITDTVYGFAVLAAADNPRVYVIPSDTDFTARLNDPVDSGVRYMLAVPPTGRGAADALNLRYPTLYDTGADVATLELEIPNSGDGQPNWRLYRVNESLPAS